MSRTDGSGVKGCVRERKHVKSMDHLYVNGSTLNLSLIYTRTLLALMANSRRDERQSTFLSEFHRVFQPWILLCSLLVKLFLQTGIYHYSHTFEVWKANISDIHLYFCKVEFINIDKYQISNFGKQIFLAALVILRS